MQVIFYRNSSDPKCVNKNIANLGSADCQVKHDRGVLTPTVIVAKSAIPSFAQVNYMRISGLNRYYYASVRELPAGQIEITGKVDALMTYNTGIRNINTTILRQENYYNKYYQDDLCPVRTTKTIIYKTVGIMPSVKTNILTVDGGN